VVDVDAKPEAAFGGGAKRAAHAAFLLPGLIAGIAASSGGTAAGS
jgi:hypothetical protein